MFVSVCAICWFRCVHWSYNFLRAGSSLPSIIWSCSSHSLLCAIKRKNVFLASYSGEPSSSLYCCNGSLIAAARSTSAAVSIALCLVAC